MVKRWPQKVLIVIRWPVGGIRTFLRYVFRNFDPQRWHFTVIAPVHFETKAMLNDLRSLNIKYIQIKEHPSTTFFFSRVFIEIFFGGYDLVHSHGFTSGMGAALPSFIRRTPHLMTSHDVINNAQFSGNKGFLKKLGMKLLFYLITRIHSVSHDAQNNFFIHFPSLAKQSGKCTVIPNGIEVERFISAVPIDIHSQLNIEEDVFLIGFLGRFMKQKGFRYLVQAVELLRQRKYLHLPFLVLTFGDGGYISEERKAIELQGLSSYFHFMPFADNVAGIIKGLDVVAMPSLWEACGLLAMETLVCGTPLIGTNCIGLREVLKDTPAVMTQPQDAKNLADALENQMIAKPNIDRNAFVPIAAERFNVKIQSRKIERLYENLLNYN